MGVSGGVEEVKIDKLTLILLAAPAGRESADGAQGWLTHPLLYRQRHEWGDRFPDIVLAARRLKADSSLIDGEVVVLQRAVEGLVEIKEPAERGGSARDRGRLERLALIRVVAGACSQ